MVYAAFLLTDVITEKFVRHPRQVRNKTSHCHFKLDLIIKYIESGLG